MAVAGLPFMDNLCSSEILAANITELLIRNTHTCGLQLFWKCQLEKMAQTTLFDEKTYFLDCLHSYPSVGMAGCPCIS